MTPGNYRMSFLSNHHFPVFLGFIAIDVVVVFVAHIDPPVTGQHHTLTIGQFAHFLLR